MFNNFTETKKYRQIENNDSYLNPLKLCICKFNLSAFTVYNLLYVFLLVICKNLNLVVGFVECILTNRNNKKP